MSRANLKETQEMVKLYENGFSFQQIGVMYSLSRQAVWERLKRAGVQVREKKTLPFIMYDGIKWTISKTTGYYRNTDRTSRGRSIQLHRYKYEKERNKIPVDWDVHHIDGNKKNNNIENLTALSKSEHTRLHSTGHNQYKNNKTIAMGLYDDN